MFKVFLYSQVKLVFYIYIIDIIPKFFINGGRFHHIPTVSVGDNFCKFTCGRSSSFHFLFNIDRIENSRTTFYTDSFFKFLHFHVITIAIVAEVSVRIFTGHIANGKIHASHKLIYMVKA